MKPDLIQEILDLCRSIQQTLGPGLPPEFYEEALCHGLGLAGHQVERNKMVSVRFQNLSMQVPVGLLVEQMLLVRISAQEESVADLEKRLRAALRLSGVEQALAVNFHAATLEAGAALLKGGETLLQLGGSIGARDLPPEATTNLPTTGSISAELLQQHGINEEEYAQIRTILGREPNITELGIFSVMWSEHCSYKNTKRELRKLPTDGPTVLVRAGEENAGVLDIGDGWAVAFKIESHNHPSAIEPFQGAATGVGGILRDIFTMGARPAFLLNSLRFGPIEGTAPQSRKNRALFEGVVSGIAHYGNCVGVPTIGGEVAFDSCYNGNPLVNVFCLGLLRHDQIARGSATGVGNSVFYVGAETGRDGLAGAAFASRELTEESKADRPAVQVGDPFREKLLMEACLELLAGDAVAGIQDMGAAGLTCSTCETASRGGTGVEIDLDLVPQREPGMSPYEILLSESQERMLIIAKQGREQDILDVFAKWDLPCAPIGTVKGDGLLRVKQGGEIVAEIPARALADDAPVYDRIAAPVQQASPVALDSVPEMDIIATLPRLLSHPSVASKRWVWEQYDHMVGTGTLLLPGSDAAVFRHRESGKILAATSDCNATLCRLNPREGARQAVAEAARNLACSGASPIGLTDNLNFGNPYKPENFRDLREAVEGLAEACNAFRIPVTGGNVSLYNESQEGAIDPTPVVAMVGLIRREKDITSQFFQRSGDVIFLVGSESTPLFDGSLALAALHGRKEGDLPRIDLALEHRLQEILLGLIRSGLIRSAHDCSEGGLLVALAESCLSPLGGIGAEIQWEEDGRMDAFLFGESPSRILISVDKGSASAVEALFSWRDVSVRKLGVVKGQTLSVEAHGGTAFSWELSALRTAFEGTLPAAMSID